MRKAFKIKHITSRLEITRETQSITTTRRRKVRLVPISIEELDPGIVRSEPDRRHLTDYEGETEDTDEPETYEEISTMKKMITLTITALMILAAASVSYAAWGDRDLSFGFEGVATDAGTQNFTPMDVAALPDGRFLITGFQTTALGRRIFLRRYLENGLLDVSFGQNGSAQSGASTNPFAHYEGGRIAVMSSGKIAVFGVANGQHAVWMYNANGMGDNTFGANGRTVLSVSTSLSRSDIKAVGTRLLLLFDKPTGNLNSGQLLMIEPNGNPTPRWGTNGSVSTDLVGNQRMFVESSTGKIVIGGKIAGIQMLRIKRLLSNGTNDTTFTPYEYGEAEPGANPITSLYIMHLLPLPNGEVLFSYSGTTGTPPFLLIWPQFYTMLTTGGTPVYHSSFGWGVMGNFAGIRTDGKAVVSSDAVGQFWRRSYFASLGDLEGTPEGMFDGWNFGGNAVPAALLPDDRLLVVGKTSVIAMARLTAN